MTSDLREPLLQVASALDALRDDVVAKAGHADAIRALPASTRASGENLAHYLALRTHDLRRLQRDLQALGLSSLGRAEARVVPTLDRLRAVARAAGGGVAPVEVADTLGAEEVAAWLEQRTARLFGPRRPARRTRILVTLEAADADVDRLTRRIVRGMDAVRINAAHDGPEVWRALVAAVREAARRAGRPVPIVFDLPGPKLRTGLLPEGPAVVHVRVSRDARGLPMRATRLRLVRSTTVAAPVDDDIDVTLPLADTPGDAPIVGERLTIDDNRGDRRELLVEHVTPEAIEVSTRRSLWLESGAVLRRVDGGACARLGALPATTTNLILRAGDTLVLTASGLGTPALCDEAGKVLEPARIALSEPSVLAELRPTDPVLFDDGKVCARVLTASSTEARLRIEGGRAGGERLGAGKGVAFPTSILSPRGCGEDDLEAIRHAIALGVDVVCVSFASSVEDVRRVAHALDEGGGRGVGMVLKIETEAGCRALPAMLFEALRRQHVGVMIARGDLAVHSGFTRLAELQEELLWMAEAAHVPVVWATEVLDRLARRGRPTRAEVTDAAMAERAECVMLNKGAFVDDAVVVLGDILTRMEGHQQKKTALLRPLHLVS